MQSTYSFYGSKLHLILEDEVADRYNRVAMAISNLDPEYVQANPHRIQIEAERSDMVAWNAISDLINKLIEINGGTLNIPEEDTPYNGLVKL